MSKRNGFKISINGGEFSKAGLTDEHSVVTCILTSVKRENDLQEELTINASGLRSETGQNTYWLDKQLKKGDKIEIEIISDTFDAPERVTELRSEEEILEKKLKLYHKLKEELKAHI